MEDERIDEMLENEDVQEESRTVEEPKEDISAKLTELEKAKRGLYRDLKQERAARQEMQQRLNEIRNFLYQQAMAKQSVEEKPQQGIPVEFDDEDNPVVPAEQVAQMAAQIAQQQVQPIAQELNQTRAQMLAAQRNKEIHRRIDAVLKEDEAYKEGFAKLNEQWKWAKERLEDLAEKAGPPANKQQALEMLLTLETDFQKQFPGMDYEAMLDAYTADSPGLMQRKLKKALSQFRKERPKINEKLLNQSGFSSSLNRGYGGKPDILDMTDEELLASVFT